MHAGNSTLCPQISLWHNVSISDICRAHSSEVTLTSPSALSSCPSHVQDTVYKFSKLKNILHMLFQLNLQKCYIISAFTSSGLSQLFSLSNTLRNWNTIVAQLYFTFVLKISPIQYLCDPVSCCKEIPVYNAFSPSHSLEIALKG